jgi:hypothetical protein
LTDIVKSVLGGSWGLVAGWILPAGIAIALFGLLILPSLGHWAAFMTLAAASATEKGWILLVASVTIGLSLSIISTQLYRILEGYTLWPTSWQRVRIDHHKRRREEMYRKVTKDNNKSNDLTVLDALALEEYRRYPDVDDQVAPTMLGNAIRRFEYYSRNHYGLDSQVCWYQLRAAAPESTSKEVDTARSGVDFFVCLLYMLIVLALGALAALFAPSPDWLELSIAAGLGGGGAVGSYYAAVKATDAWASSVKAMVDVGRLPLSEALGLEMPATLEEERDMWQRVSWLLGFAYHSDAGIGLDIYRQRPNSPTRDGVSSNPARLSLAASAQSKESPPTGDSIAAQNLEPAASRLNLSVEGDKEDLSAQ